MDCNISSCSMVIAMEVTIPRVDIEGLWSCEVMLKTPAKLPSLLKIGDA